MGKKADMTGEVFGRLTVESMAAPNKHGHAMCNCRCSCPRGITKAVIANALKTGNTKSCGCIRTEKEEAAGYLNGKFFGRLLCLRRVENCDKGGAQWLCLCDCGKIAVVGARYLREGGTQSCGCLQLQRLKSAKTTHGLTNAPEYKRWNAMHRRCESERDGAYSRYGGRGICVCEGWSGNAGPGNFIADIGPRPSRKHQIDRKDNNGGYWCGHCEECLKNGWPKNWQWATPTQNSRNTRGNHQITSGGITATIAEWVEISGLSRATIRGRLRMKWSEHDAVTKPVRAKKSP